jgi:hypothetical protein
VADLVDIQVVDNRAVRWVDTECTQVAELDTDWAVVARSDIDSFEK